MTHYERAIQFESEDRLVEAAAEYEKLISDGKYSIELCINLAVLYFVCLDGGYAAYHNFTREFLDNSFERAGQVLDLAESRFGKQDEIEFWRRYLRIRVLGEPETSMDENQFIHSKSLIPFFYLFISCGGESYQSQASELYTAVSKGLTAKERYIKSTLDSNIIPAKYKKWLK
jgi:hypothetical protein